MYKQQIDECQGYKYNVTENVKLSFTDVIMNIVTDR